MRDSRETVDGSLSKQALDLETLARLAASDLSAGITNDGVDADDDDLIRELLVFGLDRGSYAIAVERVREIVRMRDTTRLPRSPEWLMGVVALRGEIVEIVDLRVRLGLPAAPPSRRSRIIVLHGDGDRVTGILVDSVSEVLRVPESEMMPAQGLEVLSVIEVCRRGEEFVSILDPDVALGFGDG